jgi:hypothetical protein
MASWMRGVFRDTLGFRGSKVGRYIIINTLAFKYLSGKRKIFHPTHP